MFNSVFNLSMYRFNFFLVSVVLNFDVENVLKSLQKSITITNKKKILKFKLILKFVSFTDVCDKGITFF